MTDPNVPSDSPVTPPPAATPPPATPYTAPVAAGQKTNTLSIIALIGAFVIPLAGIICGHIALGQIKRTGEGGRALALWGTILGYVFTAFYIILFVIWIAFFAFLASTGNIISNSPGY